MPDRRTDVSFDTWWREVLTLWRRAGKLQSIREATLLDLFHAGLTPDKAVISLLRAHEES